MGSEKKEGEREREKQENNYSTEKKTKEAKLSNILNKLCGKLFEFCVMQIYYTDPARSSIQGLGSI